MKHDDPVPIAIIGMSCRFSGGAHNPEQLWDMISKGKTGWSDVPSDRYNWKSFYHPNPEARGAHNARGGNFITQDISEFDPLFFGITAEEANSIDPQQRFQLMATYEALENAGVPIEDLRGSNTAVYIAVVSRDYDRMIYKDPSDIPKYHLTGSGDATLCGRISYVFDFRGPSVTMDTGCSGSLVALHQACQSLRLGESDAAVVGGTNLLLGPDMTIAMSMLHMVNDNGTCYSFDSRGSGYGRAEGVAALVLKRLDDAIQNKDPIRAVIRNSGVNQDGKTNGILLPSSESQESLMRSVYQSVHIDPSKVDYVEAHGTGTAAGDAAELRSISEVFCGESRRNALYIGSVKANIGHVESAAGLAGIIKTVMAMEKGFIPPVPNILQVKEGLRLEERNIKIPQTLIPWPTENARRASINSFGFGGTNTHVIMESAPASVVLEEQLSSVLQEATECNTKVPRESESQTNIIEETHAPSKGSTTKFEDGLQYESSKPYVIVLTARSKRSLLQNVQNMGSWIDDRTFEKSFVRDLAHTLNTRRSIMSWRTSFVVSSKDDIIQSLKAPSATKLPSKVNLSYVFTGQGSQWFAMGRELLASSSVFAESISRSERFLDALGSSWSLLDELLKDEAVSCVNDSQISQPATTAVQIALVDLLQSFGIRPNAVMGHSSGEIAAAYACGSLTQESAIAIAYHRGFVSSWLRKDFNVKGAMIAVGLGKDDVANFIARLQLGLVSVACVNSPNSTTISGDDIAIDELKGHLDSSGIFNRKLKVDTAYHSHHVKLVAEKYLASIRHIKTSTPEAAVQFFSTVTGEEKVSNFDAQYWVANLTSTVQFDDALSRFVRCNKHGTTPLHVLVEIGPHAALQGPIRQIMTHPSNASPRYVYLPTLVRSQDARWTMLSLAGKIFENGCSVDLKIVNSMNSNSSLSNRVLRDLPTYGWDVDKYWHESRLSHDYRFRPHPYHDLLGLRIIGTTALEPSWRNILSTDAHPWLQEHVIDNFPLFPGSGFLCMAIEAVAQVSMDRGTTPASTISRFVLKGISFSKALVIPISPDKIEVILSLRPSSNNKDKGALQWEDFRVTSITQDGTLSEHCRGAIAVEYAENVNVVEIDLERELEIESSLSKLQEMKLNCGQIIDTKSFYDELRNNGVDYGSTFSTIQELQLGQCQAVGIVAIPDVAASMPSRFLQPHYIHPATFDALMHIALPLYSRHCSMGPVMLTAIDEVTVSANINKSPGEKLVIACDFSPSGLRFGSVDVNVFQDDSNQKAVPVLTLKGEEFRGIGEGHSSSFKQLELIQKASYETKFGKANGPTAIVPHLIKSENFAAWATKYLSKDDVEEGPFHQGQHVLKLEVQNPGLLETLIFSNYTWREPLQSNELEVQVFAHSITQRDVAFAMGRLNAQAPMIGECAGIVTAVGSQATSKFKIGDRIFGWGGSSFQSLSRINFQLARIIPDQISFVEAASIPFAFQTAYYCIKEVANIQQGQTLLISSVTSEVGLAAASVAQSLRIQVFAIIEDDNQSHRDTLVKDYGIVAGHIFSASSNVWNRSIPRLTNGRGVDVILNCNTGPVSEMWSCLADFGTFVDISTTKTDYTFRDAEKNTTYVKVDMPLLAKAKPDKIETLFSKVAPLLKLKDVTLLSIKQFAASDVAGAFRTAQSRRHIGKIILETGINQMVPQIHVTHRSVRLNEKTPYLIVGDEPSLELLGCRYLASRGAKDILLLHKQTSDGSVEVVTKEMQTQGVTLDTLSYDPHKPTDSSLLKRSLAKEDRKIGGILYVIPDNRQETLDRMRIILQACANPELKFIVAVSPIAVLESESPEKMRLALQNAGESAHNAHFVSLVLDTSKDIDLFVPLEYATCGQAILDECEEVVVGLDIRTLSTGKSLINQFPFFQQLVIAADECAEVSSPDNLLAMVKTLQEAIEIVSRAISQRLATFVAVEEDDIDWDIPIATIGLDSLVAIEFKNWIGRTLLAPLQTSEILDARSIQDLASLIIKRSSLVHSILETKDEMDDVNSSTLPQRSASLGKAIGHREEILPKPLPRLPLPDMESTLQLYLDSIRSFCADEEYKRTCEAVRELQQGELGRKLHERLANLERNPTIDCWLEDLYNSSCFLSRRVQLVPFSNFFFTHKLSPFQHSQAERAAIIASSAFEYKQMLEANQLETQYLNEQPVCTYLNNYLFNTARRPGLGLDSINKFPGNDYLVVLSHGRVFKVVLADGGKNVPFEKLRSIFEAIISKTIDGRGSWIGILTADERNSWAKVRDLIKAIDPKNEVCLDVIEKASFLICLDDVSPETPPDRARHYHFGDGRNRWNDKSLQFPVCRNGISGIIGDHTMLDAGTVFGLNAFVTKRIMDYKKNDDNIAPNGLVADLEEYSLLVNEVIDMNIDRVRQDFAKNTTGIEHAFFTMSDLGGSAFRALRCAPKSAFQIIAILASKLYFGTLEPCWESVSLSNFHKGRVENNQGLLPPVKEFLDAVGDDTISVQIRRKLFFEAVKSHANSVTRAVRGRGFDRYLTSLRQVLEEGEETPQLFKDPIYARTRPRKFMSHTHETGMLEQAYLMRDPEAIWLHYIVEDDSVRWSMSGPIGRTQNFRELLEKSADIIKSLFNIE